MLILSGFVNSVFEINEKAEKYYINALRVKYLSLCFKVSHNNANEFYKSIALCNLGIVQAKHEYESFLDSLN